MSSGLTLTNAGASGSSTIQATNDCPKNPVLNYFSYNPTLDESKCIIPGCDKIVPTNHIGNLRKHITRRHRAITDHLKAEEEAFDVQRKKAKESRKRTRTEFLNGVQMSAGRLKRLCVRLVTVHGRPLKMMDDEAFKELVNAFVDAMPQSARFVINQENTREAIKDFATEIRTRIKEEVKGKLICLKVDSCSRDGRNFFAVNIQMIVDGHVQLRTLATKEMNVSQTAKNLKKAIEEILRIYQISVQDIYSFTSDNGANMILTASDLAAAQEETFVPDIGLLPSDLEEECTLQEGDIRLQAVRCAAHTLQIAVEAAMKEVDGVESVIEKAKEAVKILRSEAGKKQLRKASLPLPPLNVGTRWHTTVDMLLGLLRVKSFINDQCTLELNYSEADWDELTSLIATLEPAKIATKRLQAEQLLLGDLLGIWATCKSALAKLNSPLAEKLKSTMDQVSESTRYRTGPRKGQEHKSSLFDYPGFHAAIFLDPRYFNFLTESDVFTAKLHLRKLWQRAQQAKAKTMVNDELEDPIVVPEEASDAEEDEEDELDRLMKLRERQRKTEGTASQLLDIEEAIINFYTHTKMMSRKSSASDVLQFWETQRSSQPAMYALACVALSVPATQVSVERLFSSLKFILSPLRNQLSSEVVDDMLLIRTNSIFMKKCPIDAVPATTPVHATAEAPAAENTSHNASASRNSSMEASFESLVSGSLT